MFYLIQTEANKFLILEYLMWERKPVLGSYINSRINHEKILRIIDSSISKKYLKVKHVECFI
jgi:hypothetical protein